MVLWYHAIDRLALINNSVSLHLFQAQGKKPDECTFGYQSDISKICNFGWHEWVCYRGFGSFPEIMRI